MKKVLSIALAIIMILQLFSFQLVTMADEAVTITVKNVSGNQGDTINVKINISSRSNIQACGFDFLYDQDVLEIISAQKGSALITSPIINTNVLGKVVFSYAATSPITAAGSVVEFSFKIKNDAPYGKSALELKIKDLTNGSFNNIPYTISQGELTVIAPKLEAPDNISLLSVEDTSASIYWNGIEDATGYNLYVNGTLYNESPITENIYSFDELNQNTKYNVQVTAIHYTTESDKSESFTFTTKKSLCFVTFVDWYYDETNYIDGSVLGIQTVEYGGDAIAPTIPSREGYSFTGWDHALSNITSNLVIYAQYQINTYTVRFLDDDGTVLKSESVEHGSNATPPEVPEKDGYIFMGWNNSYESITRDIDITALWNEKETGCEHVYDNDCDETCNLCGNSRTVPEHTRSIVDNYVVCSVCGEVVNLTGIFNVNGTMYLMRDGKLVHGENGIWSNGSEYYMINGRPAGVGVHTVDGEKVYVVNGNKAAEGFLTVTSEKYAKDLGITVGQKYLFEGGKLVHGKHAIWSNGAEYYMINGRPASPGVHTVNGAQVYVVNGNKAAEGFVTVTSEKYAADLGITAGQNYLFKDGKLVDGEFATWANGKEYLISKGRPAMGGAFDYQGKVVYIRTDGIFADGGWNVTNAQACEKLGIEPGRGYLFDNGVLVHGKQGTWVNQHDYYMDKGRPFNTGISWVDGLPYYIVMYDFCDGIWPASGDKAYIAEAFGVEAGKSYLFEDGRLVDGKVAFWNGTMYYIVMGRPTGAPIK